MKSVLQTDAPSVRAAAARDGIIRSLDPRARILAAVAFAVVCVSLYDLRVLCVMLLIALLTAALAQLPLKRTMKQMLMMDGFVFFMLLLLPFTVPGEPMFSLFGFPASWQGLMQAAAIGLKANAVLLVLIGLVGSMEPTTLGHALSRLRVPDRLVHLMLFTVRYIDVIYQEYQSLCMAMKVRGFVPGNNRHTYRSFGYLIGMLLVRALERSERIMAAMKCRGFTGRFPLLSAFRFRRKDGVFALVWAFVLSGPVFMEFAAHAALL